MTTENFIAEFNLIADEINQNAIEKGWWSKETPEEFSDRFIQEQMESGEDSLTVSQLLEKAFAAGQKNPERNEGELLALIHSELSEGLEGLRKDLQSDHIPEFKMIEEELADAIIRIMDYGKAFEYRIAEALVAKNAFNKTRSFKHGGKNF